MPGASPSEADRGHPGAPGSAPALVTIGPAVTCCPASSPRTSVTYSRITAIGRSGRPTEAQNPGP